MGFIGKPFRIVFHVERIYRRWGYKYAADVGAAGGDDGAGVEVEWYAVGAIGGGRYIRTAESGGLWDWYGGGF